MGLPAAAASHAATHPMLALLVDRDADTRHMYAEYLKLDAWRIDEAADGREALAKAIAAHPDVIITETRLPGISGFDLCGLLRHDALTQSIPIVVVTGDAFQVDVERARAAGADSVLVKPCLPETLLREIQRVMAQSYAVRARANAVRERLVEQLGRAERVLERSRAIVTKHSLKRAHLRGETTTPPVAPPTLVCPACDRPLIYQRSHVGGVSAKHQEQWDYFECQLGCGTFQYRVRTRKLRKVQ